jgi:EAL domain-containing protein (putative c-di-GMP-specific phosphodiesterase class I)
VDDFGTGYSSLSRLREFPLTAVKVDKSFVLAGDERSLAVIEGTVLIARRFGLRVIAEGVETAEQAAGLAAWAWTSCRATTSAARRRPGLRLRLSALPLPA